MRLLTHLITAGITSTVVLTGTAVTASAQSTKITDKRADVLQIDDFEEGENGTVLNRSDSIDSGIDVKSLTVKHGKKSLKVTMRFADLTKEDMQAQAAVRVKGDKEPRYLVYSLNRKKVGVIDMENDEFDQVCTGKQSKKAGKNGTITFTVARSCFKKPKAVKVQAASTRFITFGDENFTIYQDAISSSKVRAPQFTKWLKAS